ncbi:CRISPR-associated protein Cas4 [uncultured Megasphaera sp.]|uniref:CRISPR-associated protein Cas4 n=1 Tax=uncultured Megasphaera sp. TaxID=165188 RepID=UPI00265911BE|nr:CRISPR-associated protein Cas4 [uncultured Megasphaera sp.]
MKYHEDQYLMISGLQHFVFCRRQWALIHLEQVWQDNYLTAEGIVLHKNAHNEKLVEKRNDCLTVRGMRVSSSALGMSGICDVVEFHQAEEGAVLHGHDGQWQVVPIEYKRGTDKEDDSDALQLCCQAMCLEDMLACTIPMGYLYYHAKRRRTPVTFTEELRSRVQSAVEEMHEYYRRGYTPKSKVTRKCRSCSLRNDCVPQLCKTVSVKAYYASILGGDEL